MKIYSVVAFGEEKSPIEEARPIIDEKIAKQQPIPLLLPQGNELASISRLPNEVLGLIFVFASATSQGRLSMQFNFTHVSQRWRFVALGTPEIWCSIPFHNREWAPVVLERSKSADLLVNENLYLASPDSPSVVLIKEVLKNHTPRIRELAFIQISSAIFFLLLGDMAPLSLRLRSLCLQSSEHENVPFFSMELLMNPEVLQNLDLERVDVDWIQLPLTTLVSLKIHCPLNRPSWTDFITALRGLPILENLDLYDSLPVASEVHQRPFNPVKLTRLRNLSLHSLADINEVLNVLSFIVVRQTTRLNIGADMTDSQIPASAFPNLAPSLSAFISEMTSEHNEKLFYRVVRVSCTNGMLHLLAWRESCEVDTFPVDQEDLRLSFFFRASDSGAESLQGVLPSPPVLGLVTLELDIDVTVEQKILVATFGNLPHLRNVTVTGDGTNNFLLALLHKPDDYNTCASAYYSTFFPALRSIEFRGVVFTPNIVPPYSLESCLMERWERNAEISKLVLSNCFSLYEPDVRRLQEIVVDVDWDGLEQEYQLEEDYDCDYDYDYTYTYTYDYDYTYTYTYTYNYD